MTADLAAWLLADDGPIAEDEQVAQAATAGPWQALDSGVVSFHDPDDESGEGVWPVDVTESPRDRQDREHIAAWNPARVLAECAAKRAIVAMFQQREAEGEENAVFHYHATGLLLAIRALAQPYAGRPGWRDEWAA